MAMEYPQSLIQGQEGMRVGSEECVYLRKHETCGLKYAISFPILKLSIHLLSLTIRLRAMFCFHFLNRTGLY